LGTVNSIKGKKIVTVETQPDYNSDFEPEQGADKAPFIYASQGEPAEVEPVVAAAESYLEKLGMDRAVDLQQEIAARVAEGQMSYDRVRISYIYLHSIPKDVFDYLFGSLRPG